MHAEHAPVERWELPEPLVYRMKRPRGGLLFLGLTPDQLLARIRTLVPPPRTHAVPYHGVFAPNANLRAPVFEE